MKIPYIKEDILDLSNNNFYCTELGSNFDLVLEYIPENQEKLFTLTNFFIKGPINCTCPVNECLIFIYGEKLPNFQEFSKKFNNFKEEDFNKLTETEKKDENYPIAFIKNNNSTLENEFEFQEKFYSGKYLHNKFISCFNFLNDKETNIDISKIGLIY
jgi:hypothetical protein